MSFNIFAPHFQDADKAREYLEAQVWPHGPVCPHCASLAAHYEIKGKSARPGLYKCKDCRQPFTVTVGSVFESSKVPLHKWLLTVHLISASKKGISAHQLHRMLNMTYRTAWFMAHRVREAMKEQTWMTGGKLGGDGGPVEVDETYWGTSKEARETGKRPRGGANNKMKVVSLVERNGRKRSFAVPRVNGETLRPIMVANISAKAHLMTDEAYLYRKMGREDYADHSVVNHQRGEYARHPHGKPTVTTNTVESSFALLKRGLYGTFHHVSEQHLQRYATEFDFRWNYRVRTGYNDEARAEKLLDGIHGRRLMYRQATGE